MVDTGSRDVSRHVFSVAYDGKALTDGQAHSIDVQALAPALLAFGKLIREANAEFNGKKSTAKVLVVSDFEHRCFNINFEAIIGLFEQIKTLIGSADAKSAKDILQWLGLLGVPGLGTLTYLAFLKLKNGRKVTIKEPITDTDKSGTVKITFEGTVESVEVHNHIYNLSENPKALRAGAQVFINTRRS